MTFSFRSGLGEPQERDVTAAERDSDIIRAEPHSGKGGGVISGKRDDLTRCREAVPVHVVRRYRVLQGGGIRCHNKTEAGTNINVDKAAHNSRRETERPEWGGVQ